MLLTAHRPPQREVSAQEVALTTAMDAIESKFYKIGSLRRGLTLTVGEATSAFPMTLLDASSKLQGLVSAARPSAFGKGQQTVLDPSVRVAKELTAAEFTVDLDPQAEGLLEQVRMSLVPEASAVRAELYKMNLMTAGGFFKAHKDTPRGGETCFGTLVVVLPVQFQGGDLVLIHVDQKVKLD